MRCEQCGVRMRVSLSERWKYLRMRMRGQQPIMLHHGCIVVYLNKLLEKDIDEQM